MKKLLVCVLFLQIGLRLLAQGNSFHLPAQIKPEKGKAVKYNAFGMGVFPSEHLMVGGNHLSYRKIGFGLSWRVGIRNYQISKEGFSAISYDTAVKNNWIVSNSKLSYSYGGNLNFVFPVTKKIPLYLGVGIVRERHFVEIQTPFAPPGETEWQLNPNETKFKFNFGAGIMLPLFSKVVLNLGYDHLPQTLFVGIAISGPFNYEDLDMW